MTSERFYYGKLVKIHAFDWDDDNSSADFRFQSVGIVVRAADSKEEEEEGQGFYSLSC